MLYAERCALSYSLKKQTTAQVQRPRVVFRLTVMLSQSPYPFPCLSSAVLTDKRGRWQAAVQHGAQSAWPQHAVATRRAGQGAQGTDLHPRTLSAAQAMMSCSAAAACRTHGPVLLLLTRKAAAARLKVYRSAFLGRAHVRAAVSPGAAVRHERIVIIILT